ncbi:MAG: hypothetical protein QXJ17_01890 [Nitrososphaeria archaeon]
MISSDSRQKNRRYQNLAVTAISGALYAVVGITTYFGLNFYGVKFWPAVIVPATVAILFGARVGGASAALGIFIADVVSHGIPLLSLTVGVPSNYIAFYLIGQFCRQFNVKKYLFVSTIALAIGSTIIGVGIYLWSQYFPLPFQNELTPMTFIPALYLIIWTFLSEAPFLYIIVPPLVKAIKTRIQVN